ncbi:hypothetical protein AGMMS50284_3660 [Clostridia bacterium]|nr:hypothetical protein AGMMS50284_3660 [Clostridia bacterium]
MKIKFKNNEFDENENFDYSLEEYEEDELEEKQKYAHSIVEKKHILLFALPISFTSYTLTDKKLVYSRGFWVNKENEVALYKISDITYIRSLFQRFFGLGSIVIEINGNLSRDVTIKNIKNSREFKEALSDRVESEKINFDMRLTSTTGRYDTVAASDIDAQLAIPLISSHNGEYGDFFN